MWVAKVLLLATLLGGGVCAAPSRGGLPSEDQWTERDVTTYWQPETLSRGRINADSATHDPATEKVLLNLLAPSEKS